MWISYPSLRMKETLIIVPGKILGAGNLGHSIIVYAYSVSKISFAEDN